MYEFPSFFFSFFFKQVKCHSHLRTVCELFMQMFQCNEGFNKELYSYFLLSPLYESEPTRGTLKVITISSAIMENVPRMVIVFSVN